MSFLLACPACGPRDVYEFRYGGEVRQRPLPGSSSEDWGDYLYARANVAGVEEAWWFHRAGCRRWFVAQRDTRDNRVIAASWPAAGSVAAPVPGPASGPAAPPAGDPEPDAS